jgi:exosortase/archaeosortase family protein
LPFVQEGFAFFIGAQRYVVINDCAALPYLLVGLFVGLSLSLLIYRRWWKIAALTLFAGGISLLANAVRISGIITYDYITGSELTLSQHEYFEWFATALNFLILFAVFSRLTPDSPVQKASSGSVFTTTRLVAPTVIAAALVAFAPLIASNPSSSPADNVAIIQLPASLSGWTRQDATSEWQPRYRTAAAHSFLSDYTLSDRRITVFIAQPKSGRDKVSGGSMDLIGNPAQWMPSITDRISLCADSRCIDVRYVKQLRRDSDRVRHVYNVFATGADLTSSVLQFRFRRARAQLTGEPSRAMLIAIATEHAGGLEKSEIAAIISALTL